MQFIEPTVENKAEWDAFVHKNEGSVFSQSKYLDATADHWLIVYNDNQTGGMVCAYTIKAGQAVLYSPFFNRYSEWLGKEISETNLIEALKKKFSVADLQLKGVWEHAEKRHHQVVFPDQTHYNQQVKRSLKKAAVFTVSFEWRVKELKELIEKELTQRIESINSNSLPKLWNLVKAYENTGLKQLNVYDGGVWKGGLWLLETENTVLYLKGTVDPSVRKQGAMYTLIHHAIVYAHSQGKVVDFGGSNVENVRRFNLHFGAQDVVYSQVCWNHAPLWWRALKKIKDKWNAK
jgi:hypothetical protein